MFKYIFTYFSEIGKGLSQNLNTLFYGDRDQLISGRMWEAKLLGKWYGAPGVFILDTIFFFDKNHCEKSFLADTERTYLEDEIS